MEWDSPEKEEADNYDDRNGWDENEWDDQDEEATPRSRYLKNFGTDPKDSENQIFERNSKYWNDLVTEKKGAPISLLQKILMANKGENPEEIQPTAAEHMSDPDDGGRQLEFWMGSDGMTGEAENHLQDAYLKGELV